MRFFGLALTLLVACSSQQRALQHYPPYPTPEPLAWPPKPQTYNSANLWCHQQFLDKQGGADDQKLRTMGASFDRCMKRYGFRVHWQFHDIRGRCGTYREEYAADLDHPKPMPTDPEGGCMLVR